MFVSHPSLIFVVRPKLFKFIVPTTSSRVSLDALVLTFGVDDSTNHPFSFSPLTLPHGTLHKVPPTHSLQLAVTKGMFSLWMSQR